MNDHDVICVARTENQALAHVWRQALEAEGIDCKVSEYLTTWLSEAPWIQAEVWVHVANAPRAREIIQHHVPHHTPDPDRLYQDVPGGHRNCAMPSRGFTPAPPASGSAAGRP